MQRYSAAEITLTDIHTERSTQAALVRLSDSDEVKVRSPTTQSENSYRQESSYEEVRTAIAGVLRQEPDSCICLCFDCLDCSIRHERVKVGQAQEHTCTRVGRQGKGSRQWTQHSIRSDASPGTRKRKRERERQTERSCLCCCHVAAHTPPDLQRKNRQTSAVQERTNPFPSCVPC